MKIHEMKEVKEFLFVVVEEMNLFRLEFMNLIRKTIKKKNFNIAMSPYVGKSYSDEEILGMDEKRK